MTDPVKGGEFILTRYFLGGGEVESEEYRKKHLCTEAEAEILEILKRLEAATGESISHIEAVNHGQANGRTGNVNSVRIELDEV